MMKKISLIALLVLFAIHSFGQNALIWKVSGNGIENPSYLFGTIHAICPDDFFLPEKLDEIIKSTDNLYLEIDMTDAEFMQKMQIGMMNPQMKNIQADLSEAHQKLIDEALIKYMGGGLAQMGALKPWALASMLAIKSGLDCPTSSSYEAELIKLAKANGKSVNGLETIEDQLALFNNIPYDQQLEWLVETVTEMEENKALLAQLIATYKKQDVKVLYKLMLEQEEMEEFAEVLLDQRNENWIPVMTKAMGESTNVFAFGAGHLGGEKGVLNLLKKAGYKVEAVK